MSEPNAAVATPAPVGSLESVADYQARRSEVAALVEHETVEAPPAETPKAEAKVETPAADPDPSSDAGKELAKKRTSLQARIDELTREKHEAVGKEQRRIAELEARLASLEKPAEQPKPAAATAKPKVEDFQTYEEFVEALADFKAEEKAVKVRESIERERFGAAVQNAQQRVEQAAKAEYGDFDTVMTEFANGGHRYAPHVADAILNHPDGHRLAYALAKDPATNARLAAIQHPVVFGLELGKVLAGVSAPAKPAAEKPAPVSKAPEPVKDVKPETPSAGPDPSRMSSIAQWNQERKKYL